MPRLTAHLAMAAVAAVSFIAFSAPATAHERRAVGPYQLAVGFLTEPAFAGAVNGVDLRVTDTRATPAKPVEGLEKTLTVEVSQGGLSRTLKLDLRARFGQPGAYAADFVPSRAGDYAFAFKGKIETTDVNERFESGPGRFDDVRSPSALQYPDQVPSGFELTQRLADLERDLGSARAFAITALALAIVALVGFGVRSRRRS